MLDATPYDILSVVLKYLSKNDVEQFCGLCKSLRQIGLEARFGKVVIDKHDHGMKMLVCNILRQDDVRQNVRQLTVNPWLVPPRTGRCISSRSERAWNKVNTFFNHKYMEQQAQKRIQKRINKDIMRVLGAFEHLEGVEEYQILYDEQTRKYHRQFYDAFLAPTLTMLAPTLQKLMIKVPFEVLPNLSYVHLPVLRELDIHLFTGEAHMEAIKYAFDGFLVFIHNARMIEHLSITATSSSRYLDLSLLIERLGVFPHLRSFQLSIPFNGSLISYPEGIHQYVLAPHSKTLEVFKLGTSRHGIPSTSLPADCRYWIQRILNASQHTSFPRLHNVELPLRPLKESLQSFALFLESRAVDLEHLCLNDRDLCYEELKELLVALCPSKAFPSGQNFVLRHLEVKVHDLNVPLLLSISECFPNLKTLVLIFLDVTCRFDGQKEGSVELKLKEFYKDMLRHKEMLLQWQLQTLNISSSLKLTKPLMNYLQDNLADCIPHCAIHVDHYHSSY